MSNLFTFSMIDSLNKPAAPWHIHVYAPLIGDPDTDPWGARVVLAYSKGRLPTPPKCEDAHGLIQSKPISQIEPQTRPP